MTPFHSFEQDEGPIIVDFSFTNLVYDSYYRYIILQKTSDKLALRSLHNSSISLLSVQRHS